MQAASETETLGLACGFHWPFQGLYYALSLAVTKLVLCTFIGRYKLKLVLCTFIGRYKPCTMHFYWPLQSLYFALLLAVTMPVQCTLLCNDDMKC